MSFSSKGITPLHAVLALGIGLSGCQHVPMQTLERKDARASVETGNLRVSIRWPERQERGLQAIPMAADEATLRVTNAQGTLLDTRRVSRTSQVGSTSASLDLPPGLDYRLSASMTGAEGEVMAIGQSAPFAITPNQATTVPLRLVPILMSVAGTGLDAFAGEGILATEAAIQNPSSVGTDAAGNLYVAVRKISGTYGNVIRKVSPDGRITTVVGLPPGSSEPYQEGDGVPARYTQLLSPSGVAVTPAGDLLISDERYGVTPKSYRILYVPAREGVRFGKEMRAGHGYVIYTSPYAIASVALGEDASVYAAVRNWVVRVDADGTPETVAGIEGQANGGTGEDGPATQSDLKIPDGLALDRHGNLIVSDRSNHRIRMLCRVPGTYYGVPMQAGWIYTIIGLKASSAWQRTSTLFPIVDGKRGLESSLNFPRGVVLDAIGNLYVADSSNNLIRRLSSDGTLVNVAGTGKPTRLGKEVEPLGDGGPSLEATFCFPGGLAIGPLGALYVADSSNNLVRRMRL
ncbi:Serine/threonine-protein kinase PknD [compost metagenome]